MIDVAEEFLDHAYMAKLVVMSDILPDDVHTNVPVVANVALTGLKATSLLVGYFGKSETDQELVFTAVTPGASHGLEFTLSAVQSYSVLPTMTDFFRCGMST